jgi:hypothetical protein
MTGALGPDMRNHPLPTIPALALTTITGGCHKGRQPQAAPPPSSPSVDVTVATGAAGGQAIQQALGAG